MLTLIKLVTQTSLCLFSIRGQILSAVIHDISFLLYLLSLLQMKSLCNSLPFQVHPSNGYDASFALNPSGNQPTVMLPFPEGPAPHSCAPCAISSFQQLPRVYVILVMFSSRRAQRACCSAKRNPKGRESGWMVAHIACRAPGHLLCIAFPTEKLMQARAVTNHNHNCWGALDPLLPQHTESYSEKPKNIWRTFP